LRKKSLSNEFAVAAVHDHRRIIWPMKLERRLQRAATNENAGLQSGFENGMLKPSKTQIAPP
jgi:hypothetical protein